MSRGIGILTNLELYQSKSRYQRADTAARPVGRGFYRDHFKASGLHPADLTCLDQLRSVPTIDRTVVDEYSMMM